jgi:hypothetical protein
VWWPATARHLGTRLRNQQHALSLVDLTIEFRRLGKARERVLYLSMSHAARIRWSGGRTVADLEDNRSGRNPFGRQIGGSK